MILGRKYWAIAQGWIPPIGHETMSVLNLAGQDAHLQITVYYSNRGPAGPYRITVPAGRIRHVRFDSLTNPEPIPRATDYASTIESDVPIVVQHPRLDSNQADDTPIAEALDWNAKSGFSPVGAEHAFSGVISS